MYESHWSKGIPWRNTVLVKLQVDRNTATFVRMNSVTSISQKFISRSIVILRPVDIELQVELAAKMHINLKRVEFNLKIMC